jgi:hypothetical protein
MRPVLCTAAFLLLFFSIGAGSAVQAQSGADDQLPQDIAILVRGPVRNDRLPFFQPNAIENYAGYYTFRGQDIIVYHTDREIVRFEEWEPVSCNGVQLYRVGASGVQGTPDAADSSSTAVPAEQQPEQAAVYFYQNDTYVLFFSFTGELNCDFVERFLLRFDYFRTVRELPSKRPPFPAVVE